MVMGAFWITGMLIGLKLFGEMQVEMRSSMSYSSIKLAQFSDFSWRVIEPLLIIGWSIIIANKLHIIKFWFQ